MDDPGGANTVADQRTVTVRLGGEETRSLLADVHRAYRTRINEVLLGALARAFARWTGAARLVVDLEGHGREPLFEGADLSRTVGWFTSLFPVELDLAAARCGPREALVSAKEDLRRVPRNGIERDVQDRGAEVSFNYLGQLDSLAASSELFTLPNDGFSAGRGPTARRRYLVEIDAMVVGGELAISFAFSERVHRLETIRALADGYVSALRELIQHCQAPGAGVFTPSDFPLAGLDDETFRKVELLIERADAPTSR